MSALGSVFLGDVQRHRILSSPPSSPPPVSTFSGNTMTTAVVPEDVLESPDDTESPTKPSTSPPTPTTIDPVLSLELRLRWLEALLLGVPRDRKRDKPELKPGETLLHLAADVQRRLTTAVDASDGLKKFVHQYDRHAPWLTPVSALSGTLQPGMDADALEALVAEMEPDVRAADRDMREIELLEHKGVLSAGKLTDYEALRPRLQALIAAQEQDMRLAAALEKRIGALVERHATHVDTLSELFVAWDDVLAETESKVRVLERNKEEQQRLGYA